MKNYAKIERERLTQVLSDISNVKAGLIGDICLDVYWYADMRKSELSRETPHYMMPVVRETMTPGGGANVAANMAALRPKSIDLFGVVGDDWRGVELLKRLEPLGINLSGVIKRDGFTNTFIKPCRQGYSEAVYEDPRLDFIPHEPLSANIEDKMIKALDETIGGLDVLCVSDQLPFGIITNRIRKYLCELSLLDSSPLIIVDSRDRIGLYSDVYIKPNEIEGTKAANVNEDDYINAARVLSKQNKGVFMTLGKHGSMYVDKNSEWMIEAKEIPPPIDICGAGDSSLSGFGLSFAAGAKPYEAAYIAGLCSGVTIKQIGKTGVASREQVMGLI
jgi:rfaE bifunctional protein kinase chain/domain